jgi:signal transduction histidine kinase/ActR/RegA family two-component response regulator
VFLQVTFASADNRGRLPSAGCTHQHADSLFRCSDPNRTTLQRSPSTSRSPTSSGIPGSVVVIPWHRRLEARVVVGVSLVAGVSLAAVLFTTSRVVQIWLGGVTFLFALVGGVVLSRRITRPLREIATAAQDIAAGNWDRRVPTYGHDEAAAMAAAFNDMTATLTHWHTAARQREHELRQAQKMEAIGQLAGGIAHDFNNLLMAIHGYGELLLLDLADDDARRDHVKQVLKAADSAGALTRQLLAFSRKQILTPKLVNLGEIVHRVEKMLRRLIGEDIDLVVSSSADLWWVKADPGQLEQVVMNLAVNARDAMAEGGRLSITLENVHSASLGVLQDRSARGGQSVSMTVSDTGCGMDAETRSRIFEPFFTTKEQGRGTGLGLAMVCGIIEQSGGSIAVDSQPNRGTSFRILLPRAEEEPTADAHQEMPVDLAGADETILLVEDEQTVRDFVRQVLERERYRVIEATRGDEALTLAAGFPGRIHLLLTDVVMPGMSGHVLWEKLSASRRDIKGLFMSGHTHDTTAHHRAGGSGLPFLQKPFTLVELLREVRRVLGRKPIAARTADHT